MARSTPRFDKAPEPEIDTAKRYRAVMDTSHGRVVFELFADRTPITVNNFVFLVRQGFYDGLAFHRVIDGFMVQGGIPKGRGAVVRATRSRTSSARTSASTSPACWPWPTPGPTRTGRRSSSR
jgi:hypothetical protein